MTKRWIVIMTLMGMIGWVSVQGQDQPAPPSVHNLGVNNLGTFGTVFPIKERSLMDVLKEKMQSEQGRALMRAFEEKLKSLVAGQSYLPKSVEAITPTPDYKSYTFNPAISVEQDLTDHKGTRFYKAGDSVNPLDHMTLSKDYLFIDGERPQQIDWAKGYQRRKKAMIILVKGDPITVMKDHALQVFFDQEGAMVRRFNLKHVPCSMMQEGKNLRITEWVEDTLGDTLKGPKL